MIYELRIYECVPGGLPDLHRRFETITLKIWERMGIKQAGFWIADVGTSNELTYLIAWESLAEREEKWAKFQADPEWNREACSVRGERADRGSRPQQLPAPDAVLGVQ